MMKHTIKSPRYSGHPDQDRVGRAVPVGPEMHPVDRKGRSVLGNNEAPPKWGEKVEAALARKRRE